MDPVHSGPEMEARGGGGRAVAGQTVLAGIETQLERKADNLTLAQVEEALLAGEILESYPDTGRGESCLIVGFSSRQAIHVVCGWLGEKIAIITVYIPTPPNPA